VFYLLVSSARAFLYTCHRLVWRSHLLCSPAHPWGYSTTHAPSSRELCNHKHGEQERQSAPLFGQNEQSAFNNNSSKVFKITKSTSSVSPLEIIIWRWLLHALTLIRHLFMILWARLKTRRGCSWSVVFLSRICVSFYHVAFVFWSYINIAWNVILGQVSIEKLKMTKFSKD